MSTGAIHRDGREFVDSGAQPCYIRIGKGAPKINLTEEKSFLILDRWKEPDPPTGVSSHAKYANKRQTLTLKEWHDVLGHINPSAIKHLEKRGLINISDVTFASEMRGSVCKECMSEALSFGRGGTSPKTPGEVMHTDLEGPFRADVLGMKYFQVFVDEASTEKHVVGLKTRDAAVDATAAYIDDMARDGITVKCISGDGAGELGWSAKFLRMLANRETKWRGSPLRKFQSQASDQATHVGRAKPTGTIWAQRAVLVLRSGRRRLQNWWNAPRVSRRRKPM